MNELSQVIVRLGVLLVASHGAGFLVEKYLRLPRVLGEMGVGILLGFSLLGQIPMFDGQPMFSPESLEHPVFHFWVNMATIILLFNAGMHTDIRFFIKFFLKGSLVGVSGVIAAFVSAAFITVVFVPGIDSILHPTAIFMGIATATSVGVSSRILAEKNKISSIESNISITAAVLDDVLGIILLAIATAYAVAINDGADLDVWALLALAGKELLFWIILTICGILVAQLLGRYLRILTPYSAIGMTAVGFVLLMGGVAERLGLSAVIGAYIIGIGFGRIDTTSEISEKVNDLAAFFVPVFFAITGLGIDFASMRTGLIFSLIYAFGTLFIKIIACGAVSGFIGFNYKGMKRIGAIMLPRGEVTLVVANLGIQLGVISTALFGTLAFTVFISVFITPFLLMYVFKDNSSGYKKELPVSELLESFKIEGLTNITESYLMDELIDFFHNSGYFVHTLDGHRVTYQFRKRDVFITMSRQKNGSIVFSTTKEHMSLLKFLVLEEIDGMESELHKLQHVAIQDSEMEKNIMSGLIQNEKQED